jgi:hypothetical protein
MAKIHLKVGHELMNLNIKSKGPFRLFFAGFLTCFLVVSPFLASFPEMMSMGFESKLSSTSNSNNNDQLLSSHWLASNNCYRDELNRSDVDYNNCWMDNAGKILVMSAFTGDSIDGNRSLGFIERYLSSGPPNYYYLPELAMINGDVTPPTQTGTSSISVSNGLVELTASNTTASHFDELAVGTSYTGNTNLAYIGGDRIWINSSNFVGANSSNSSSVFSISNGFSKRSLFQLPASGISYYVYVNATLKPSVPFANVSIQLEPIGSSPAKFVEYLFLQAFNTTSTNPFYSGSLYYSNNGSYYESMGYREAQGINPSFGGGVGGILLAYSNATNIFSTPTGNADVRGQDALAIKFGDDQIYDWEHWSNDSPFNHSWFGPGYLAPQNVAGNSLSSPLFSEFYPILHFDYHLANETAIYVASSSRPAGVAVSPPVGFGFISYGLALEASLNPSNTTLNSLARGFWNYYYSAYADESSNYGTPYARSINLLALAGFKLYDCNSTVENFARNFIGNTSGSSVEEYGWGTAALYELKSCTGNSGDLDLYNSFVNSFGSSNMSFIQLSDGLRGRMDLNPEFTFQFAEAGVGLMLGGIPYNDSVVTRAMDAVFQSNVSGTILNSPYSGDLANTETIPAYTLSTWLFQNEMRNDTGYWITAISNANITSIDFFANGTLLVGVYGKDGSISLMDNSSSQLRTISGINGYQVYEIGLNTSSSSTTTASTSSRSITSLSSSTSCRTGCVSSSSPYALIGILVTIAILSVSSGYYIIKRAKKERRPDE